MAGLKTYQDKIREFNSRIAPVVQEALNNSRNQQEAADWLNENDVPTYSGKPWTIYSLRHFRKSTLVKK